MTTRNQILPIFTQLPLMASIAIYSVSASKANDLIQLAYSLGYTKDQVTIFSDENMAAPLEKRQGYQRLLTAMREGSVTVVFLSDEASIFSHASENELNIFIHLCMGKGVIVVSAQAVYDFSSLTHAHQFRVNCTGNSPFLFLVS